MKPEPLPDKVEEWRKAYIKSLNGIPKEELKKRVELLLKEIEKKRKDLEPLLEHGYKEMTIRTEGRIEMLDWFEEKIKKAFSGVIEE